MTTIIRCVIIIIYITIHPINTLYSQWVQVTDPSLNNSGIRSFAVLDTNIFAGSQTYGVIRSTNNGKSWTIMNSGFTPYMHVSSIVASGSNLFVGMDDAGGVYRSTDNGINWNPVNTGLTNRIVSSLVVIGSNLFAATDGNGVFLSTNNGTSWHPVNTGLGEKRVYSLAANENMIFAGTSGGGVFYSSNIGSTWLPLDAGLANGYISSLAIKDTNLFVGESGGVIHYVFNGTQWTNVGANLKYYGVTSVVAGSNYVFIGILQKGIFRSTDNGASWVTINSGMTYPYNITSLIHIGTNLFAGTNDRGIWKGSIEMNPSIVTENTFQIVNYSLEQNYPNPFNPSTQIRYNLPKANFVTLKLYDVLGNEIAIIVTEKQDAGSYSITFNGVKLPTGVYFYRLQAGTYSNTKKLLLIK